MALFCDRLEAGKQLAEVILTQIASTETNSIQPIVYALPRGGIPVAVPIAKALNCPLDIVVAKKITKVNNPELAVGAVTAEGQMLWFGKKVFKKKDAEWREIALHQAQQKAQTLLDKLKEGLPKCNPEGAIALLVDDGIATGMTIAVAVQAIRAYNPSQVWICAPVAPLDLRTWLERWCDRVILLATPDPFYSVSRFYEQFPQVETEEVLRYLQQYNNNLLVSNPPSSDPNSG